MKTTLKTLGAAALVIASCSYASAWDGYDEQTGGYVQIPHGNLVRPGRNIQMYDDGEYKDVTVQSVRNRPFSSGASVDVYDNSTGEYHTLRMR